jgi:hypothetical protein
MPDGPPRNVRALLARLRNHCRATGLDQPRVQRHLAMMVVVQLLDGAVIKGGRNLEVRYGLRATRASTDLDVARAVPLEAFLDRLDAALAVGWQGFTATMRERGPIAAPVPEDRRPYQVDIVTQYRGATGIGTVRLEVVPEEIDPPVTPEVVESRDATELFAALGLRPPAPVRLLPLAHQIAQKIHACTAPDDATTGRVNERVHDLIDLQLLLRDLDASGRVALGAVTESLFAARGQHAWPPAATVRAGWMDAYQRALLGAPDLDLARDVVAAVAWLEDVIQSIVDR